MLFCRLSPRPAGGLQFSKVYSFWDAFDASGCRQYIFRGRLYTVFPAVSLSRETPVTPGEFRCTGLGIRAWRSGPSRFSVPEACFLGLHTIYRVLPFRKNLTYLFSFCLFILKDGVLAVAIPFLCRIMYIFVRPSFSCIRTRE